MMNKNSMDIYDFIISPDIREHCRQIKHRFTLLEQAAIVCGSYFPLCEKQTAYKSILSECDQKRSWPPFDEPAVAEIKAHLKRLIAEAYDALSLMETGMLDCEKCGFLRTVPGCFRALWKPGRELCGKTRRLKATAISIYGFIPRTAPTEKPINS